MWGLVRIRDARAMRPPYLIESRDDFRLHFLEVLTSCNLARLNQRIDCGRATSVYVLTKIRRLEKFVDPIPGPNARSDRHCGR